MRLLNTRTGNFEEFQDNSRIPRYAILSHTWSPEGEQTFQDVRKVQDACMQAVKQEMSSAASYSAPLATIQRDEGGGFPARDAIDPTTVTEESIYGDRGFSEGMSTFLSRAFCLVSSLW